MIEIYVGIICVCMPSLRLGYQLLCPNILPRVHASTSKHTGSGLTGGNIAVLESFRISYSTKPQTDGQWSVVELMETGGDGRSTHTHEGIQGETNSAKHRESPE